VTGSEQAAVGVWAQDLAIRRRKQVDPDGGLWMSVIEATGQPRSFG